MKVHIADLQRDLIRLKSMRELSLNWRDFCYVVQLRNAPNTCGCMLFHGLPSSQRELAALV